MPLRKNHNNGTKDIKQKKKEKMYKTTKSTTKIVRKSNSF